MGSQKDLLTKWSTKINAGKLEDTISAVKAAIGSYKKFPPSVKVVLYLHGSHHNSTNTEYGTPVDIIIEITSVVGSNKQKADPFEEKGFTYQSFRGQVLECLQSAFGEGAVNDGQVSIHLLASVNRLPANVLVCFRYKYFQTHGRDEVEKLGVAFYLKKSSQLIINFPKQHHTYEAVKDKGSQGQFIPMVRVFKHLRKRLIERGEIGAEMVPSTYFVESFISNAPSGMFTNDYAATIGNLLDFWQKNDWRNYLTIDGFRNIWGEYPQSWNEEHARRFLNAIKKAGQKADFWQDLPAD